MADTILVTGTIDFDPAKQDDAVAAVQEVMRATQAEDGCEHYVFSADVDGPGRFFLSEQWRDQASMDAHMQSAHLAAFMGKVGSFGVTGSSLTKWSGATPEKLM